MNIFPVICDDNKYIYRYFTSIIVITHEEGEEYLARKIELSTVTPCDIWVHFKFMLRDRQGGGTKVKLENFLLHQKNNLTKLWVHFSKYAPSSSYLLLSPSSVTERNLLVYVCSTAAWCIVIIAPYYRGRATYFVDSSFWLGRTWRHVCGYKSLLMNAID